MIELDQLHIPRAARPHAEQVFAVTDAVCLEHLDEEYADLARRLVGKLARKRPTPLARGDHRIWAAGVVHALGQLNFLSDPSLPPHASADRLSELTGVKKTTMSNKAKLIRDSLKLHQFDTELTRRDVAGFSPLPLVGGGRRPRGRCASPAAPHAGRGVPQRPHPLRVRTGAGRVIGTGGSVRTPSARRGRGPCPRPSAWRCG